MAPKAPAADTAALDARPAQLLIINQALKAAQVGKFRDAMQILMADGIAPPGAETAAKLKKLQYLPHGDLEKHLSEAELAEYKYLATANCRDDIEALITDEHLDDYFANSCPSGKSGDTIGLRPDYIKAAYKDELVGRGIVREIIRLTAARCCGSLVDPDNEARKHLHWDTACNLTALAKQDDGVRPLGVGCVRGCVSGTL